MNPFAEATSYFELTEGRGKGSEFYDYYKNERGLDLFAFGTWQVQYADMVISAFGLTPGTKLLDIGCGGGANTKAFLSRNIDAWGVDINRWVIENSPHANGRLSVAGADDLALYDDGLFDFLHSQQVFEHIAEERCDAMFAELRRVAKPNALLFAGLVVAPEPKRDDTCAAEPDIVREFDPDDDPTHINVKPWSWWHELATNHGFVRQRVYETALRCHPWFDGHAFDFAVWRRT